MCKFTLKDALDRDGVTSKNHKSEIVREIREKKKEGQKKYSFTINTYWFEFDFIKDEVQIIDYILDDEYPDPLVMTLEDFYRQMCPWQYEDSKKT